MRGKARRKKPPVFSRIAAILLPPSPSLPPFLLSPSCLLLAFATLFVNYLVIECEEAESHRLNYHSWRATGGLIVYRHSGDVGMRKGRAPEIIPRSPPLSCFSVSFVNCPPRCVPIVFFFLLVFSTRVDALRKTGLLAILRPEILIKQHDGITMGFISVTLMLRVVLCIEIFKSDEDICIKY